MDRPRPSTTPTPISRPSTTTRNTVILRQNKAIDYGEPLLFLLFGSSRAVLTDTGATASAEYFPLRELVDSLLDRWLAAHPRTR